MNERIAALIKALGIKKIEFGKRLNVSSGFVTQLINGTSHPSDRTICDICREFGVNEIWLRTGEGEMFRPMSVEEEIAAFVGDIISDPDSEFQRRFIRAMAKLTTEQWKLVEDMVRTLSEEEKEKSPE